VTGGSGENTIFPLIKKEKRNLPLKKSVWALAQKRKCIFHLTSRLREVQFPRKSEPREAEVRRFSEMKLNLGERSATSEPLNRCYTRRAKRECNVPLAFGFGRQIESIISRLVQIDIHEPSIFCRLLIF